MGGPGFLPRLDPGMRLLDVGCGTGSIAREVAARISPGEVIAVDRQEGQIEGAKRFAAAGEVRNLRFVLGDAEALRFPTDEFDGVYCRLVLEHVTHPEKVVAEMRRVAKPGAWVCACEWEPGCFVNYPESKAIEETWRGIYHLQQRLGGDPWVARKLYRVFTDAGLTQVRLEGRAWTISAQENEKMRLYVGGAREIIRQASSRLLAEELVTPRKLEKADSDYSALLESPVAFVLHGFCTAIGTKPGG